jgi:aryl-alcohol dehydrogenase
MTSTPFPITGAVMRAQNKLGLERLDLSRPRPDEVIVRVLSAGICGTDIEVLDGHLDLLPTPVVLGHEGAGVVEEVGQEVAGIEVGDTVILTVPPAADARPAGPAARAIASSMAK